MDLIASPPTSHLGADHVVESRHPAIVALAEELRAGHPADEDFARAAFEWVRDEIAHSNDVQDPRVTIAASQALEQRVGLCFAKSHLLVALLRAEGVPAGFCYQRLADDGVESGHLVHGLVAVHLNGSWHRQDPRGNKTGVDAQFSLADERLAWPVDPAAGEVDYPFVFESPARSVIAALQSADDILRFGQHGIPNTLTDREAAHETQATAERGGVAERAGAEQPWPTVVRDLEFRVPTPADIEQVVAFRNLPAVNRFMIRTSVEASKLRAELTSLATSNTDYSCVVARGAEVVAIAFLDVEDGTGQPGMPAGTEGVIGYIVHPNHWGQGIATVIVPELLRAGFESLGLRRITASCTAANTASPRALERAGMRRERHGIADEWHAELGWTDSFSYALLAEEWQARVDSRD